MCGLVTLISPAPSPDLPAHAARMLATIAHRGPDDRQILNLDTELRPALAETPARVTLGFHRLAILDLSPAGRQPMRDPTGRWWIILNGEIYNHVELREELERSGERFQSGSDTEVLLRLLTREGLACLPRLDGMFAFVAVDTLERRLLAVRDRFGVKPLYWWRSPDGCVALASEIKAFTAHPAWRASLNRQRAWDYLTRGLIDHKSQTLFEGVHSIPAGHLARIDLGGGDVTPRIERWYELKPAAVIGAKATWSSRFLELLTRSVARQLRADVTVGSCLSGGLDSSSIVCLAAEALRAQGGPARQMTFTARSPIAEQDEWSYATQAAALAEANAIEVRPSGEDLVRRLEDWVWIQDEPFSTPSMVVQHAVFQAAKSHGVKVMLDGQGADEQLAGYHSFFKVRLLELLREGRFIEAARAVGAIRSRHRIGLGELVRQTLSAAAPVPWLRAARRRHTRDGIADAERLGADPIDPFDQMTGRRNGITAFSLDLLQAGSLPMLLHWEDRNSMAHGVEARVPFLNHELVEFVLALPGEAKLRGAMTKHVLREAMRGHVPEAIRTRVDKIAFAAPEEQWLCTDQRADTIAALRAAEETCGGFLRPGALAVLDDVAHQRRPYDGSLWRVLCFAAWMRRFSVVT